jgi:hypothetical protein
MRTKECFGFDLARVSNLTMAQGERRPGDPFLRNVGPADLRENEQRRLQRVLTRRTGFNDDNRKK